MRRIAGVGDEQENDIRGAETLSGTRVLPGLLMLVLVFVLLALRIM
jgi:hypothetical protein